MSRFEASLEKLGEFGTVRQVRYPIAFVEGLPGAHINELVYLDTDTPGRVVSLESDYVHVALLTSEVASPGQRVARTDQQLHMDVGPAQRGGVVNPLGQSILTGIQISGDLEHRAIDIEPPPLETRSLLGKPLHTGTTIVDLLVPLASGQREAVFGDQKTGKTSFLLATARAHAARGGIVVYALIGRPWSDIRRVYDFLRDDPGTQENVIVVATQADDVPSLITLTPFSAMTVAEYWRDQGKDVVLILHDLSTHAKFHREVALIAGQFPGRESYPGDIFHEHARLLERAGNFDVPGKGQASITCFPVVETVGEDLTNYIVSNVISITDGHLMFDQAYYSQGQRPAVKPSASVTRVGLKVQSPLVKQFHRQLLAYLDKVDQAESFSHFGAELSADLKEARTIGERLKQLFIQPIYLNATLEVQLVMAAMVREGWFNEEEPLAVGRARERLLAQVRGNDAAVTLLEQVINAPDVEQFTKQLTQHKDELLALCQTEKISKSP